MFIYFFYFFLHLIWGFFITSMKATPEEGISTQESQLMGISSSSIVGIVSTDPPVLYQSISILQLLQYK